VHFLSIVLLNYFLVVQIRKSPAKKGWLIALVTLDAGNLFFFKYFYFFLQILQDITGIALFQREAFNELLISEFSVKGIILPLAISFYTFQLIAYAVDTYRGEISGRHSLLQYLTFITFFPQLVAGPIVRHSEFFHQIEDPYSIKPDHQKLISGIYLIIQGVVKKILIADNLVPHTALIFGQPERFDWFTLVAGCFAFGAQLYCDFSGYTDLARGQGKLLGIELPENFFAPYFSRSVRALWNNWHRTLTSWLRDYVYIAMGGQSVSFLRTQFNVILTWAMVGLWHGASYNYLLLGVYHGCFIALEIQYRRFQKQGLVPVLSEKWPWLRSLQAITGPIYTLLILGAGFVMFITPDMETAGTMYERMFSGARGERSVYTGWFFSAFLAAMVFNLFQFRPYRIKEQRIWIYYPALFVLGFIVAALLGSFAPGSEDFFYFKF
tara:strand:+ start:16624 stop:17937 length:1314 start_codon:yes stop_codon:yes gene_type:complete